MCARWCAIVVCVGAGAFVSEAMRKTLNEELCVCLCS